MDMLLFILFSMIEGMAITTGVLAIFRFDIAKYWKSAVFMTLAQSLLSYLLRNEMEFSILVPFISLGLLVSFVYVFVARSILWAAIMAVTGFVAYSLFQTILMFGMISMGLISLDRVRENTTDLYIALGVPGVLFFAVIYLLYLKGYGWTFDLERFRWNGEHICLALLTIITMVGVCSLFVLNDILLPALVFGVTLAVFLYYQLKKDNAQ